MACTCVILVRDRCGLHYIEHSNALLRVGAFFAVLVGPSVALYHLVEAPMIGVGARLASAIDTGKRVAIGERELNLEMAP